MNDADRLAIDPSFQTEQERAWDRERWRRIGWGYPEEEVPPLSSVEVGPCREVPADRGLVSIQVGMRHLTNKLNEHIDASKKKNEQAKHGGF